MGPSTTGTSAVDHHDRLYSAEPIAQPTPTQWIITPHRASTPGRWRCGSSSAPNACSSRSLIATYLVYRGAELIGPCRTPSDMLDGKVAASRSSTFRWSPRHRVLLFSSLFMVLALTGAQKGNRGACCIWLLAHGRSAGIFFVGVQVYEFSTSYHKGLGLHDQPLRHDILHVDRVPRHPRHRRRDLAALGPGPGASGAIPPEKALMSRSRHSTGTSSTSSGS